ncbi:toll receptor 4, partial [Biomphalaria glabrata]
KMNVNILAGYLTILVLNVIGQYCKNNHSSNAISYWGVEHDSSKYDLVCDCGMWSFVNETCKIEDNKAECMSRKLVQVPSITEPHSIEVFNLSCNCIETIANTTFIGFTSLLQLDLSHNKLWKMEPLAFLGLNRLIYLNLRCNHLVMKDEVFHENVFSPLASLEILKMNGNNPNLTSRHLRYPENALSKLVTLKVLSIDGLKRKDFGPSFQNLTSLTSMTAAGLNIGFCKMTAIRNTTFLYLVRLKYLDISSCFIDGSYIDPNAFSMLTNLHTLNLTQNEDIDIQNLNTVFFSLRNITTLRVLSMHLIVNRYSLGICLDSSYIKYFPQHLEHFEAQENNLEGVDQEVFSKLSPSLKHLDIGRNRFVFGIYLRNLSQMTNLTSLTLSGGSFTYNLPSRYPFQVHESRLKSNCTIYTNGSSQGDADDSIVFSLPPNLKSLEMNRAGLSYTLSTLNVSQNSLKYLSMTNNYFPNLIGPFYGFDHLEYMDLSFSFVQTISKMFFSELSSLLHLNLSSNLLGSFFCRYESETVFYPLTNLMTLNLSFNDISELRPNIFANLVNLRQLQLQKNNLQKFDVNITSLIKLVRLNLKLNRLSTMSSNITDHIDTLIKLHESVVVDLSFSPISCQCNNLAFINWMVNSKAFHPNFINYQCVDSNTIQNITDNYTSTVEKLNRECSSNVTIFLISSGFSFVILCFVIGSVIYRFRWRIRYLYYAAYLYYSKTNSGRDSDYKYDAFISYDQNDWKFVVNKLMPEMEKRRLKVCIHSKDFVAGDYIASNIVKAICSSSRTVVVLTRNMIKSYWCGYEIQMANMEAVHTNRKVLLFLMMEDIPSSELSVDLLYNIRNNTYLQYNQDGDSVHMSRLWDKLAYDIKH